MIEYLFLFLAVLPGLEPGTTRLQYYYNFRYQASSWVLSPHRANWTLVCSLDFVFAISFQLRRLV